jgi:hypothetical protein
LYNQPQHTIKHITEQNSSNAMTSTSNTGSICGPGPQAFSVFCDATARDMAVQAEKYREENSVLAPIDDRMQKLSVCNGAEEVITFNLTDPSFESDTHYVYKVSAEGAVDNTTTSPTKGSDTSIVDCLASVPILAY